ncbi:hypothetical protein A3A93_01830 [Candidatus Roizmanbacteria bacterium RIFCSPLOWO2_01_FULL_38_12]|uniref:Probable endonuclease 4 n=1 Tax=Candidatus Roizmanbacteria bacterium RIFCSPLOWO2_01_FULL_38_12 TaxID=1802061 RepID=A0A1F7IXW7_9BACT|nr:MAG: hypothetical protein A2861_01350 [Candidatus Roizmanbacteria bacterium RIFCSPHIGHO2_01_FULL_38_15]OGK36027.1 MAG: hypothetical protein A3F59_01225 [Candidatus Roizmanbacteria bacterium RIFCSPHIGHO2_12_FULL_38_13]OGK48193.1 MAG: hypothetical protein A3A93_01830 [Candidatus Roizmanbacteria bacterium RIFCSPLOWO2_01_FULL_38_12]
MHKLGAHLSISGRYEKAIESIENIGGNCLQIFSASPRQWQFAHPSQKQIETFVKAKKEFTINPVYFHASYLINLGFDNGVGKVSVRNLINEFNLSKKMQVRGSIVHLGSLKREKKTLIEDEAYYDLIENIKQILKNTPEDVLFIIENAGTNKLGKTLNEIALIINSVDDDRLRVCLDTCHLHAAGYNLTTYKDFEEFLSTFDSLIGLEKLELVHMNDSRDLLGSFRDRHENIGKGNIAIEVFKNFLNNPKTKHLPFIIETPGFDDKGPDKENLDILKGLIS